MGEFKSKLLDVKGCTIKNNNAGIEEHELHTRCLIKCLRIEKVEVDVNSQKVVVTGYAHRNKILKAIRRGGLKADFWSTQNELLSVYASASYGSLRFNNFNPF
ncbi:heavy metal-associated isoprenylated plant protein 28-like [Populus alba x Populus x berolinensis]|nr:heavy metal-associated isoprenylated plant protein 28-like [Populus alba x Populus x berolinensis]